MSFPARFTIESLGCAKNQVDSETLIALFEERGLRWVERPEEADLILVNTCGFIAQAKEQSIEVTLELRQRFPDKAVVMLGCLVERYARTLQEEMPEVDAFAGTLRAADLDALLARLGAGSGPGAERRSSADEQAGPGAAPPSAAPPSAAPPSAGAPAAPSFPPPGLGRFDLPRRRLLSFPGSAYVKVAEGCGNRCTYCAIPLIRGELASRDLSSVLQEIRLLLERAIHEIVLVAQDLASFGRDRGRVELEDLVGEISRLEGDFWLRLMYLHPDHFPLEILPLLARDRRLLPYFDIPFQHASPRVLARMGRRGSKERYLELLEIIRRSLPEAVIRSTFLVGFPGEEEEDFRLLQEFQERARLDWLGLFAWSREEGTAAARLRGRVPAAKGRERIRLLEEAQTAVTENRLEQRVGQTVEVLVEEGVQGETISLGRAWFQAPEVDGLIVLRGTRPEEPRWAPGRVLRARIVRRNGVDLEAFPEDGP